MAPISPLEITPLEGYDEWKRSRSEPTAASSQQHKAKPKPPKPEVGFIMTAVVSSTFVAIIIVAIFRLIQHKIRRGSRQGGDEGGIEFADDASALSNPDTLISASRSEGSVDDDTDLSSGEVSSERDHGSRSVAVVRPRLAVLRGMRRPNGWKTPPPPYTPAPSYGSGESSHSMPELQIGASEQLTRVEGVQTLGSEEHDAEAIVTSENAPTIP